MPRDACLYFPHIEIRDQSWTRSYLLFWDELRTIVPDAVENPYQRKDLSFLHGEGILSAERLSAHRSEVDTASKLMIDNWAEIARSVKSSQKHIEIAKDLEDYHLMHPEKMTDELIQTFRQHLEENAPGVGEEFTYRNTSGWQVTDPEMATAYMAILANEIAATRKSDPVTNYSFLRVPNPRILEKRNAKDLDFEPRLLEIIMENTIIDPNADIRKLVAFKRENQALFNDFREELSRFRQYVEEGYSRYDLYRLYTRKIRPKVETLRRSLTRSHFQWVGGGCLALPAVPDSAAAVAELFGTSGNLALAATFGIVLTGVGVGAYHSSRNALRGEPMSYLAIIDRKFTLPPWER